MSRNAGSSKRRQAGVQPIRCDSADVVHPWLANKPDGARLFKDLPGETARMLRQGLAAARRAQCVRKPANAGSDN